MLPKYAGSLLDTVIRYGKFRIVRHRYRKYAGTTIGSIYDHPLADTSYDDVIWTCWLQGEENAPPVVRACIGSMRRVSQRDVIIITDDNIDDYLSLPDFIIEKYRKGMISRQHLSDIIRFALLYEKGGMWLDSTVFCTSKEWLDYLFGLPLFTYRPQVSLGVNDSPFTGCLWCIRAKQGNPVVGRALDLLLRYWKDNNRAIHYFITDFMLTLAADEFSKEWSEIPCFNVEPVQQLSYELGAPYTE